MPDVLEVIEQMRGAEADVRRLFGGDEGTRMGAGRHTESELAEAQQFLNDIRTGRRKYWQFEEAMSTSDFPVLMGDILDRQLVGNYQSIEPTWQAYIKKGTVRDFRKVKRVAVDGAEGVLGKVGEQAPYPEGEVTDKKDEYSVSKFGRRLSIDWEDMINDDLGGLDNLPGRLAISARRTEQKMACELWIGKKGPSEVLYKAEFKNIITGNPALDIAGIQKGLLALAEMKDFDNEPIVSEAVVLVIPPALEVTANNILHAISIDINEFGGTEKQRLRAQNWMQNKLQLVVDPYIPAVASEENGNTTWGLFASPSVSRPAAELGFLRGYETPSLYEKAPDARQVGGGEVRESFENDTIAYRIRHVLGGTQFINTGGYKATVASSGKGS
jgi:hypothetical protein